MEVDCPRCSQPCSTERNRVAMSAPGSIVVPHNRICVNEPLALCAVDRQTTMISLISVITQLGTRGAPIITIHNALAYTTAADKK